MPTSPTPKRDATVIADRYRLERRLGSGSFGSVYLARDLTDDRLVALKLMRTESLDDEAIAAAREEFLTFVSVSHPRIAKAYDFGYIERSRVPYYTREYIAGAPLAAGPPVSEDAAAFLQPILDLLDALGHLHESGFVHLDVHAGNLIVADDVERGSVLIDLGVPGLRLRGRFSVSGTDERDLPPEVLQGREATPRSDIYLAGRLLIYRLTGSSNAALPFPREIHPWGVWRTLQLERVASKAVQEDPSRRFASAAEFHEILSEALDNRPRRSVAAQLPEITFGRQRELDAIEDTLRRGQVGEPAVLAFFGDSGVGKSRLLLEARHRAQLRGFDTICVELAQQLGKGPTLVEAIRKARRARPGVCEWIEALDTRHGGTPEERAARAAAALFERERGSLALIVDDIDVADSESRVLLGAMVIESGRVRRDGRHSQTSPVFVATRDALPHGVAKGQSLRVRPLSKSHSSELFARLLHPLHIPPDLVDEAVSRTGGLPRPLRQLALTLRDDWQDTGTAPTIAALPLSVPGGTSLTLGVWARLRADEQEALAVLAVLSRSASAREIACALDLQPSSVARCLRRLIRRELVSSDGGGRGRRYRLSVDAASSIAGAVDPASARHYHERVAATLEKKPRRSPGEEESLARHYLFLGRREAAEARALAAAESLSEDGSFDRAVRLLEDLRATTGEEEARWHLEERISDIFNRSGDHARGVATLRAYENRPPRGRTVQLLRRLGVHYHRSGDASKAVSLFSRAGNDANSPQVLEDQILIDSELAEIYLLQGRYVEADRSCRRGLERLASLSGREEFRRRMEVVLRASLGHLALRRMSLQEARRELRVAAKLSRRSGTTSELAAICNNLGIVENQLNRFSQARQEFHRAERLLLRAGDRRTLVDISLNLAMIGAKLGERNEAFRQLARGEDLCQRHSGWRHRFFLAYSRGAICHSFGEEAEAIEALEKAIPLGRRLADSFLVGFAELNLAEALVSCARYRRATRLLRKLRRDSSGSSPLLQRMACARLAFVEALLGRTKESRRQLRRLNEDDRTDYELLEAWNDVFSGYASLLDGKDAEGKFSASLGIFERLEIPVGERFARLGELAESVCRKDTEAARKYMTALGDREYSDHDLLSVAEPVVRAQAHLLLHELDQSENWLDTASAHVTGTPFLEFDIQIEYLRGIVAAQRAQWRRAQSHLDRALRGRNVMLELVPDTAKKRLVDHPRMSRIAEASSQIERTPRLTKDSRRGEQADFFHGMLGRSSAMRRLFEMIERCAESDQAALITGETGSGKELVARALHAASHRRTKPFVAVQCAALPDDLADAELFGYEEGAFTGAKKAQTGLLDSAEGGVLLLDGVSELPARAQASILRMLDAGALRRVGGNREHRVDVRILASASMDLDEASRRGKFRADLFYRLATLRLELPALRERVGDIRILASYFLASHATRLERAAPRLDESALLFLERYPWPGNVRQFESVLLRAMVEGPKAASISASTVETILQSDSRRLFPRELLARNELSDLREQLEREYLTDLFLRVRGRSQELMDKLGIKRTQLYAWFRRLGIDVRELRRRL